MQTTLTPTATAASSTAGDLVLAGFGNTYMGGGLVPPTGYDALIPTGASQVHYGSAWLAMGALAWRTSPGGEQAPAWAVGEVHFTFVGTHVFAAAPAGSGGGGEGGGGNGDGALVVNWDPPLAQDATTTVEYYLHDALGSVRVVTNAAGAVLRTHDYWPFGFEVSGPTGGECRVAADPRGFTGQERDPETCQDYFGGRYYRADLGRFTSVDPVLDIDAAILDPQRWNRYAYVVNNPLQYTDPDGRVPLLVAYAVFEVASALYDVYNAYATVTDPKASAAEKSVAVGGAALSAALPGGFYGTGGRAATRAVEMHHLLPQAREF